MSTVSALSWLAFSDEERQRAQDALGLLRERDTRDELGLAGVRDAFSDLLFPGTSTIQTRAGYLLFVPWIYRALEEAGRGNSAVRAARAEHQLIQALRTSPDPDGTIGLRAGPDVQRLPSSVYWQGLQTFGIRRGRVSIAGYHVWLDHPLRRRVERDDDGNAIHGSVQSAWDPELPDPPASFPDQAAFALTSQQATYLRDRVMLTCPGTMLAFLVDRGQVEKFVPSPWAHPQRSEMPSAVQETIDHGELFSLGVQGAALLYNLMAAERAESADAARDYRRRLDAWSNEMDEAGPRFDSWDMGRFWEIVRDGNPRLRGHTQRFVSTWLEGAVATHGHGIADDKGVRASITRREISIKGEKNARLASSKALARWSGESGAGRMTFRWSTAQQLVLDIRKVSRAGAD